MYIMALLEALFTSLAATGVPVTQATQCLTDTFTVTAPGNNAPPSICGSNSGDHSRL